MVFVLAVGNEVLPNVQWVTPLCRVQEWWLLGHSGASQQHLTVVAGPEGRRSHTPHKGDADCTAIKYGVSQEQAIPFILPEILF